MAGAEVFKFAVRIMGNAAEEALRKAEKTKADIDLLVPHQANIRIIQSALDRLGLPEEKCMVNLHKYGNVSAGSIPIALAEAVEEGRVKEGDCLVMVGFGGGLTWGASVLVW
jgi:3-oxoacyl-[acyl-carrier-protein] synthase-3